MAKKIMEIYPKRTGETIGEDASDKTVGKDTKTDTDAGTQTDGDAGADTGAAAADGAEATDGAVTSDGDKTEAGDKVSDDEKTGGGDTTSDGTKAEDGTEASDDAKAEDGAQDETGEDAEEKDGTEIEIPLKPDAGEGMGETGAPETLVPDGDAPGAGSDKTELFIVGGILIAVLLLVAAAYLLGRKKKGVGNAPMEENTIQNMPAPAPAPVQTLTPEESVPQKAPYAVGRVHDIGMRSAQQDSFAVSDVTDVELCEKKGVIAIVADGMGGLADGDKISSMVTLSLFKDFHEKAIAPSPQDFLLEALTSANDQVNRFLGSNTGKCGSTLVAAIVRDKKCFWISVGDSHIYLYRGGSLLQLNREHVYAEELDAKAASGVISREEALGDPQRKALTSYIGMGRLEKVDRNLTPLILQSGDRLLFMSDGVFGTVPEQEIAAAMAYTPEESAAILDERVRAAARKNQDNYTALILECR